MRPKIAVWGTCKYVEGVKHNHVLCDCPRRSAVSGAALSLYRCVLSREWTDPTEITEEAMPAIQEAQRWLPR